MLDSDDVSLCQSADIGEGQARGFDLDGAGQDTLFVVRSGGVLRAWRNNCPHADGAPMAWRKDGYMSADGQYIVCHGHGAKFRPDTGECVCGPCLGQRLSLVDIRIDQEGRILLDNRVPSSARG